jgi:hypothetical protein
MLDVACAVRGGYVPHSAAMLHSVLRPGVRAHYLHDPGLRGASRRRLARVAADRGGEIVFHEIADDLVGGLRVHGYFRTSTASCTSTSTRWRSTTSRRCGTSTSRGCWSVP